MVNQNLQSALVEPAVSAAEAVMTGVAAGVAQKDGFRVLLEKAVRTEEDVDWTQHTVDYGLFKARLKNFARRRARLRNLLRESHDGRIPQVLLTNLLSEPLPPHLLSPRFAGMSDPDGGGGTGDGGNAPLTDYLPFVDDLQKSASSDSEASAGVVVNLGQQHNINQSPIQFGRARSQKQMPVSGKRKSKRSCMRHVSNAERKEMVRFLAWEMDKAQMFYLSHWQRLSARLDGSSQSRQGGGQPGRDVDLGDEILELIAFCVINIVAARQILIRYDAFARTFEGTPMLHYYMKTVMKHPTSFRKLLFHEEINAVADAYCSTFDAGSPFVVHFAAQRGMFQDILNSSESRESVASTGHERLHDSLMYSVRDWYLLGAFEDRLGLEPSYLTMRGTSLTKEMEQLGEWRKKKHEIVLPTRKVKSLSGMQVYHLTLNLISGFLYCMNYYIVEPSSTMYVNHLGAHDAMSGTLIGMMPLAAFVSSIPFSIWTNRSFRHPFIMSCFLLIVGNLTYSLADRIGQRVWVALLGRFICGLGAPKCIIRRYMADTTPMSLRTSVNALFGMVVAAGSAMGPAMAVMLNRVEYIFAVPLVGFISFNGLTLPGYFMSGLWFTFTVIVLATFEEPDREGLKEQKEMEKMGSIPGSPSMMADVSSQSDSHHGDQDEIHTIFSGDQLDYDSALERAASTAAAHSYQNRIQRWRHVANKFFDLITLPVRICLGLLFAKVFTIEALVSATSALTKNRYRWKVQQVGTLGFTNGLLVIPFSILVGRLSLSYQDLFLMKILLCGGLTGLFLLIDISDLVGTPTSYYNKGSPLAVSPSRYRIGYFFSYLSIQAFEGVIGSTLSKVIPTALASGTVNSGLLATLIDTLGRTCGDLFISAMGFLCLRQLMNLLFIPTFCLMLICLVVIEKNRDILSV